MPRQRTPAETYPVQDLISLCFAAYEHNERDIVRQYDEERWVVNPLWLDNKDLAEYVPVERTPNTELVKTYLRTPSQSKLVVTDQHRAEASTALDTIDQWMFLQTLQGRKVSSFTDTVLTEAKVSEQLPLLKLGLLQFIPQMVERIQLQQRANEQVSEHSRTSEYLGSVGDKVNLSVEVIRSSYLTSLSCWVVTANTDEGNLVQWFTSKEECTKSGQYKGIIKGTEVSDYLQGAKVTTLNRVKSVV